MEIFGHLFFLAPFLAVMIWTSWPFVVNSVRSGEISTNAGGLIIWPSKILILAGFILLALQGVSEFIKRVAIMRGELEDTAGGGGHAAAAEAEAERLLAAQEAERRLEAHDPASQAPTLNKM
jgi:TRAP-type mannitol/chloroaromatic compound transport system permease small subunit